VEGKTDEPTQGVYNSGRHTSSDTEGEPDEKPETRDDSPGEPDESPGEPDENPPDDPER